MPFLKSSSCCLVTLDAANCAKHDAIRLIARQVTVEVRYFAQLAFGYVSCALQNPVSSAILAAACVVTIIVIAVKGIGAVIVGRRVGGRARTGIVGTYARNNSRVRP